MLYEPLLDRAAAEPDLLAVIDDHGRYTYAQLAGMARRAAAGIIGQTKGSRIGILLPASAGFVCSFYGAILAGKAVVPINYLLGDKEIDHCIGDSGVDAVITIPQLAPRLARLALNVIDVSQLFAADHGTPPPLPSAAANDLAVLMYTSGTSGLPKGVCLTYQNLQSNVDAAIAAVGLQGGHRFLGILPLFHAFGMTAMMLAPIQLGAAVVYLGRFSPVAAMNAVREHQISLILGVPSMYGAIARLKDASPDDFKSIYAMISGGEPLAAALREGFLARFGVPLLEAYGMTETSLAVAVNTPDHQKPGSVGRAVPGITASFTDDDGKPVAEGKEGEIWIKGPMVTRGYNNLPEETARSITAGGFFKTGDLGRIDDEGYLYITGRKKDLIIIAGEKASPREIEEVLTSHPAVAEAAVVGKKDATRGEIVVAFVIAREGEAPAADVLRDYCRQQGLAQWKVPREIRLVADLPRSPTGKVLKRLLAEQAAG